MTDLDLLIRPKPVTRTEVCRSFAYKLNAGNYESRDFFCSQKAKCTLEDAAEVSAALYQFCRSQVLAAVKEYIADMGRQKEKIYDRKSA